MKHNFLHRRIFGVELGTVLLLVLVLLLLDPALYTTFAIAASPVALLMIGANLYKRRQSQHADTPTVLVPRAKIPQRSGVITPSDPSPSLPNASAGRRKIQLVGIRMIEGRLELFHIFVSRDQESWLVWRSKDQIFDLRKRLCAAVPDVSIPQLPSALNATSTQSIAAGGDATAQAAVLKRHQDLVCAWLDVLNDTPVLRDTYELAEFLDDHSPPLSEPSPLHEAYASQKGQIPLIFRGQANSTESSSIGEDPTHSHRAEVPAQSTSEKSTMKRLLSLFKRKTESSSNLPVTDPEPEETHAEDINLSKQGGEAAVDGPEDSRRDTARDAGYNSWLREKQRELGFSGDSYETFEFTDIAPEQRAQFKDSGAENGFKLRGMTYKQDGKKVPAGQPLSRLLGMESYRVDSTVEGKDAEGKPMERHDHVASRGVCRRRIDAVLCLREPPFLFVMNFQLPGDPPVSMVSYFAIPAHLARNLGTVSNVPKCYQMPPDLNHDENAIPEDVRKAMCLFEQFADFPKNEFERLALWGIEGDEEDKVLPVPNTARDFDADIEQDSSLCSESTGTTGIWSASQRSGADTSQYSSGPKEAALGGRRYQKALRKEAEARDKQMMKQLGSDEGTSLGAPIPQEHLRKPKKKSILQRIGLSSSKIIDTGATKLDGSSDPGLYRAKSDVSEPSSLEPTAIFPPDAEVTGCNSVVTGTDNERRAHSSDANSVVSEKSGPSRKSSTSRTSHRSNSKGGWKMPSDIKWADPYEKGVYPPEDIRNKRFKLTPLVVDGPWVVKATVPTQPAILGQKVVIRYFRGNGYVECDIHVGSSIIALQIVGLLRGYAKHFVSEVGVTLQGENEEELPEKLFASILLQHPDPAVNRSIDE